MSQFDERSQERQEDGFVLVAAIWFAGLLAVAASAFVIHVRMDSYAGANYGMGTQAEFAADGLVRLAAWRLSQDPANIAPTKRKGLLNRCRWNDELTATVTVQDQGGILDLNSSSRELFRELLSSLGKDSKQITALLNALIDFGDADSEAQEGGAEPQFYPGEAFGPKNAPFQMVEELAQVPGFDDLLHNNILPWVTVHSRQPGFDPEVAPESLMSVLGISREGTMPSSLTPHMSGSPAENFSVSATVTHKNGMRFRREALIALTRQTDRPFTVLAWRRARSVPREIASEHNNDLPNCLTAQSE